MRLSEKEDWFLTCVVDTDLVAQIPELDSSPRRKEIPLHYHFAFDTSKKPVTSSPGVWLHLTGINKEEKDLTTTVCEVGERRVEKAMEVAVENFKRALGTFRYTYLLVSATGKWQVAQST